MTTELATRAGHVLAQARLAQQRLDPEVNSGGAFAAAVRGLERALEPAPTGAPVVAVVGRTRAGKSTLRYVLTGEGEDGIGKGAQRTTTDTIEYCWDGVALRDTPGVGARGGAEDAQLASLTAATADVLLWVVTSDGLQRETVDPIREMLSRGVRLLVVVNHKQLHDLVKDRTWDHDALCADRQTRETRLRDAIEGVGEALEVVHVQLDVARWARGQHEESAWKAAGLPCLEETLRNTAKSAAQHRAADWTHRLRRQMQSLHVATDNEIERLSAEREATQTESQAVRTQMKRSRNHWRMTVEESARSARGEIPGQVEQASRAAFHKQHRGEAQRLYRIMLSRAARTTVETFRVGCLRGWSDLSEQCEPPSEFTSRHIELQGDPLDARVPDIVRRVVPLRQPRSIQSRTRRDQGPRIIKTRDWENAKRRKSLALINATSIRALNDHLQQDISLVLASHEAMIITGRDQVMLDGLRQEVQLRTAQLEEMCATKTLILEVLDD